MIITGLICGALLGFVMQRGRFCLTSGFRDMYIAKNNLLFYALLIAIGVQSVGVFTLIHFGVIDFSAGSFSWLATIIGSFIFGLGIVFAGGCATGTWYRAGEGLLGSWTALFGYMFMSAVMRTGFLGPMSTSLKTVEVPTNSIAESAGIPVGVLIAGFVVLIGWIVYREMKKPKIPVPSLQAKYTGIRHVVFEKRWHPFVTALLVGIIAILAWPLSSATGRVSGLGITTPSANILQFAISGDMTYINWAVFLVIGILFGSYLAAKGNREFRFRMPDAKTGMTSFLGGNLMGFGASLAGGCSIGNGLVMTAMMTWQGWISLLFMIIGTWTASYFMFIRPKKAQISKKAVTA